MGFHFTVYEWFQHWTRYNTEATGNLEMAYWIKERKLRWLNKKCSWYCSEKEENKHLLVKCDA